MWFCPQALLDVYTIKREIGKLDSIKVALVGDLANGRTVRSLAYLLAKYKDVKIFFVSPDIVKMKVTSCTIDRMLSFGSLIQNESGKFMNFGHVSLTSFFFRMI